MKFLILVIAALGFACSSATTKTATPSASTPEKKEAPAATAAQNTPTGKEAETKTKGKYKKAKKEARGPAPKTAGTEGTSAAENGAAEGEVKCASGGDSRTIAVTKTKEGCEVKYTKGGQANSIANGASDMKHCNEVSNKIMKNLKGAGFTCTNQ